VLIDLPMRNISAVPEIIEIRKLSIVIGVLCVL
jgi:hypothetical protein